MTERADVVVQDSMPAVTPIETQGSNALMQIIARAAFDPACDPAKLAALLAVKKEWEADEARKAFAEAMTQFKINAPKLKRDKHVEFQTTKGVTKYDHATLDVANETIIDALSAFGLTHRWEIEQGENDKIRVTCVLTHRQGHSERTTLQASRDDSGGKNAIQALGSSTYYLERYTLFAATGLAPRGKDDDGRGGGGEHVMPENVKADFLAAVESLSDMQAWEALWKSITTATTACGDVAAHEELRAAMAAKRKALK